MAQSRNIRRSYVALTWSRGFQEHNPLHGASLSVTAQCVRFSAFVLRAGSLVHLGGAGVNWVGGREGIPYDASAYKRTPPARGRGVSHERHEGS